MTTARRRPVAACPPLVDVGPYDYADAFAVAVPEGAGPFDAAVFVREALEDAPAAIRAVVDTAWRLLGFRLGPRDAEHILGWRIVAARPDAVQIAVSGSRMDGVIVGRTGPAAVSVTTYLRYVRPTAALRIWAVVGHAHRRVAPYLIQRRLSRATSHA